MARLLKQLDPTISNYFDRRFPTAPSASDEQKKADFDNALRTSTTVYIGNLAFTTSDFQLYELFSKAGDIKRLIMGLDANRRTPCGFCFVSYFTRKDAEAAVKYINGSMMDGRAIRVDHDWGYVEGRQFGRGRSGGQLNRLLLVSTAPAETKPGIGRNHSCHQRTGSGQSLLLVSTAAQWWKSEQTHLLVELSLGERCQDLQQKKGRRYISFQSAVLVPHKQTHCV